MSRSDAHAAREKRNSPARGWRCGEAAAADTKRQTAAEEASNARHARDAAAEAG